MKNTGGKLFLLQPDPLPDKPPAKYAAISFPQDLDFFDHPGYGLTPRRLVGIMADAESGWPQGQCDLFEDILETDGHLRSQMDARIDAVAGRPWAIAAGGTSKLDVAAAQALAEALGQVPNFGEFLEHQLTANGYGYAATELVWEFRDGLNVPAWFGNVPHRRFVFDNRDEPKLLTKASPTDGIPLEPGSWVFTRRRGRRAARAGILRTAIWWSLFKRTAVRDWVVFAERFGLPFVTGEYALNAPEEDKAVLKQAVQKLGTDGNATFSETCKINVHTVEHGGKADDVHGALVKLANLEISKLFSGATLTSETGGPGSFALGAVHQSVRFELISSDVERLSKRFQQDLAVPFLTFNPQLAGAKPPRLKIHVVREADPKTRAEVMVLAQNSMGLPLDEDQIRSEFQLKKPDGAEGTKPGGPAMTPAPGTPDSSDPDEQPAG